MYLIIIMSLVVILWFSATIIFDKTSVGGSWDYSVSRSISVVFAVIFFIVILIVNFISNTDQIKDYEELKAYQDKIEIYENKTENLTEVFQTLLAEKYPQHEKEIFSKISPDNIELYFVKYPEIKTMESFKELVIQIKSLNDVLYAEQIYQTTVSKRIRFRFVDPFIVNSIIKEVPDKYKEIVY